MECRSYQDSKFSRYSMGNLASNNWFANETLTAARTARAAWNGANC